MRCPTCKRLYNPDVGTCPDCKADLELALSTLHTIASMTVFCDDKETYQFCLDEARKMACEVLDEVEYKCNCPGCNEMNQKEILCNWCRYPMEEETEGYCECCDRATCSDCAGGNEGEYLCRECREEEEG